MLNKKRAILDANINRVGEGLRVIEDWARFYMNSTDLTKDLRKNRHNLWSTVKAKYPEIIRGRDSGEDILADKKEGSRSRESDIPGASFNRVKEGLRVLEEMGKLIGPAAAYEFKKMRFDVYKIEKKFYQEYRTVKEKEN
ncbi:MAG: hypothetical protein ACQEQC_00705 [Elusimicrobiota bacterium]